MGDIKNKMKRYVCKHCDKGYDVYSSYYTHVAMKHADPKVACAKCTQVFHTHAQLYKHAFIEHTTEIPSQKTTTKPIDTKRTSLSSYLYDSFS